MIAIVLFTPLSSMISDKSIQGYNMQGCLFVLSARLHIMSGNLLRNLIIPLSVFMPFISGFKLKTSFVRNFA